MRLLTPSVLAILLCALAASCRPSPSAESDKISSSQSSGGEPADKAAPTLLSPLHHAAEEAALDAFQSGKRTAGWPGDTTAKSGAEYFAVLTAAGYLKDSPPPADVRVANVREEDPLHTSLFALATTGGRILVIRKDGRSETVSSAEDVDRFAPPPPRDPAWLP